MAALKSIGTLLLSSGWTWDLVEANLVTLELLNPI